MTTTREQHRRYNNSEKGLARGRDWNRNRYDADPIWRHEKLMRVAAYKRARTLQRLKQRVEGDGRAGPLQAEG